ncbi:MAG: efflux RND transporter periplasmic adaptor subunit [Pirellulales bacterium]|nr:efflux RND transporter periplasmic adaptor subunit [Pirellulales bacterium]
MQPAFAPLISITILLIGTWCAGCHSQQDSANGKPSTKATDFLGRRQIIALGRLQPRHGIVSVSALPGERLAKLDFHEGDVVREAGISLGELESHKLRAIELAGLQAQYNAAQNKLNAELAVAEARVQQAEAALALANMQREEALLKKDDIELLHERSTMARADLDALRKLAKEDPELATEVELNRRELGCKQYESEWAQARESFELAVQTSKLAVQAAEADLAAAQAVVDQAKTSTSLEVLEQQIEAATIQKTWSTLPAPCPGIVLKTFVAPGEFISQTPVLQLADLSQMACLAEVYEADIQWIHPGDPVRITSHAFLEKVAKDGIRGHVTRISPLIGLPGLRSLNPMDRSDRHVVEVMIEIDPADMEGSTEAARLVGLQVKVTFGKQEQNDETRMTKDLDKMTTME